MDGLNDAAKEFVKEENKSDALGKELGSVFCIVFENDGLVLGLGCIHENEISRIYIDPDYQRKGIGKAIVRELEIEAERKGFDKLIGQASLSSETFYHKLGFKSVGAGSLKKGEAVFKFINIEKDLADK